MSESKETRGGIRAGTLVVVTLREPREKCWGVLDAVTNAGVYLRAVDLQSFEEIVRASQRREPLFGIADLFFPLWRVERLARDAASGTIPSLAEQFTERTGHAATDIFDFEAGAASIMPDAADAVS